MDFLKNFTLVLQFACLFILACDDSDSSTKKIIEYEGPFKEIVNAKIFHSDSGVVKAKLDTPLLLEFENGDQEMPKGLFLEFFNGSGQTTSTLKANYAHYSKEEDVWLAVGDVELFNQINQEKLNTEQLYWKPTDEKIYTEKFVRIETDGQILMGEGLEAAQDFSTYKLLNPTGELTIEDE